MYLIGLDRVDNRLQLSLFVRSFRSAGECVGLGKLTGGRCAGRPRCVRELAHERLDTLRIQRLMSTIHQCSSW